MSSTTSVASRFCVWSSFVALSLLLSKFGHAEQKQQQKVCSAISGNNTFVSYSVPYNNTELWLNCNSGDSPALVIWLRPDGTLLCQGNRSCLVNRGRWLTYDDSGNYTCKTPSPNGTDYQFVHIDVLAPPMLQTDDDLIMDCHGEHRDHCFVRSVDSFPVSGSQSINMTASYRGEGPFSVQWYHNGEIFDSSSLKGAFRGMTKTSTSQTILLRSQSMQDALAINGTYRAVVSNQYGVNESLFKLQYNCEPASIPTRVQDIKTVLPLVEGSKLNTSCAVPVHSLSVMYGCISKNLTASLNDSINAGECVRCTRNGCDEPNFTNITVSRLSDNSCPINQLLNFISDRVTLDDDGIKITCAFVIPPGLRNRIVFQSILLDVTKQRQSSFPLVPVLVSAFIIVAVLSLLCVAVAIRSRVARSRHRDSRRATITAMSDGTGPREDQCAPLVHPPDADSVSQYNDYRSISPGSVEPTWCQDVYASPSVVVPLHD